MSETPPAINKLPKRGQKLEARSRHLVFFVLTDKAYFRHATVEAARQEREYLEARTGKTFKLMKLIHCSSEELLDGTVQVFRNGRRYDPVTGRFEGEAPETGEADSAGEALDA